MSGLYWWFWSVHTCVDGIFVLLIVWNLKVLSMNLRPSVYLLEPSSLVAILSSESSWFRVIKHSLYSGQATGWRTMGPWFEFRQGKNVFLFCKWSRLALRPPIPSGTHVPLVKGLQHPVLGRTGGTTPPYTVELNLSGLIWTASYPEMQK
jgi:hypothetical protein